MIGERKFVNYFYYAIGEIVLVVAGILIALSINSHYKAGLDRKYEILMLREIESSIDITIKVINEFYYQRVEWNENAYRYFYQVLKSQYQANEQEALTHLDNLTVHFLFSYDDGAYEALKSTGLDKINNSNVRRELISLFEAALPRAAFFAQEHNHELKELAAQMYTRYVRFYVPDSSENDDDDWLAGKVKVSELLDDPQFLLLLRKVKESTYFKRIRLDHIVETLKRNKTIVASEIERLQAV